MNCALITGISGFVGSHLAEFLLKSGISVCGITRSSNTAENMEHVKNKIKLIQADMMNAHSIKLALKEAEPDYVFHLAAQSVVSISWTNPADTLETNIIGTSNLLEAIRKLEINPVIHVAGSCDEYGFVLPEEIPIKETNPLRPVSPYGVSKVAEDLLGWQYFKSYGMKTVRTRAFNHTGPRRGEQFVTSSFAKQIAMIEKEKQKPIIYVGNLNARRDFTDVRDVVRAYWIAVNKCDYGDVYNICSEESRAIQSVLKMLLSLTNKKIEIKTDPTKLRPSDFDVVQGDCSKFMKKTGWKPEIPFEKTMKDLLNYWRERV